jgi:IS30 family transposase
MNLGLQNKKPHDMLSLHEKTPQWRDNYMGHKQITFEERKILERLREEKHSMGFCAKILGKSVAAISLEIKKGSKNINRYGRYSAELAQNRTVLRRRRARSKGKQFPTELIDFIKSGLKNYWSPEQIAGRLQREYPDNPAMRVAFKTIYRWVEAGKLSTEPHPWKGYTQFLRLKRRGKTFQRGKAKYKGKDSSLPSIDERPVEVLTRSRFGDWEGDLIRGFKGQGYIATLVERRTGFLLATPCRSKHLEIVNSSIFEAFLGVPTDLIKTITFDRGKEFYGYEALENKFQAKVYFCHPHCPNERAQNEQTNGLLRQFFPKRHSLANITLSQVKEAVALINNRPKKKLGFRTTIEFLTELGIYQLLSLT